MGIFGSENKAVQPDENKSQMDVHDEIDQTLQNNGDQNQPPQDQDEPDDDAGRVVETDDAGDAIPPKTNAAWYLYDDRLPNGKELTEGVVGYFRLIKGVLHYSALLKNGKGEYSKFGERDRSVEEQVDVEKWPHQKQTRLAVIADELQGRQ